MPRSEHIPNGGILLQRVREYLTSWPILYDDTSKWSSFIRGKESGRPSASVACGQQANSGFVKTAVKRLLEEHPDCRVRVSTPQANTRIAGVAGGQFDMAIVNEPVTTIQRIAGMELYVETLFEDELILVANPPARSPWKQQWLDIAKTFAITPLPRVLAMPTENCPNAGMHLRSCDGPAESEVRKAIGQSLLEVR